METIISVRLKKKIFNTQCSIFNTQVETQRYNSSMIVFVLLLKSFGLNEMQIEY